MNRGELLGSLALGIVLTAALFGPLAPANAADVRKKDPAYVTQKALGEYDRSSGWCGSATTSPANIWASANVPAELKTTSAALENRRAVRWVYVYHADRNNGTVPMCVRLGPNTGSTPTRSALSCTGTSGAEQTNGQMLSDRKDGRVFLPAEIATTDTPEVYVVASTGTVEYCVEVAWKS